MICAKSLCKYVRDRGFASADCVCMDRSWSNQILGLQNLETTIFYGKFYIDIPLSILNINPGNIYLFRKSQNRQNRRHYLHRKYSSDLPKVKIWQHYAAGIFLYV